VPSQTTRSDEQIEWQQFATPPRLAWLAARACALRRDEQVLEPSAGTGMLAVWAAKAGCPPCLERNLAAAPRMPGNLVSAAPVTGHDGELIDELLDPDVAPSVVLMNPPYSHGIERGHDGRTGARHLRSAWKRLLPGGRLVAVMPEWFDLPRFFQGSRPGLACGSMPRSSALRQARHLDHHAAARARQGRRRQTIPSLPRPTSFAELCSGRYPAAARDCLLTAVVLRVAVHDACASSRGAGRETGPAGDAASCRGDRLQPLAPTKRSQNPRRSPSRSGIICPTGQAASLLIPDAADHPTPVGRVRRHGLDHRAGPGQQCPQLPAA
jgi:hypothetical protein